MRMTQKRWVFEYASQMKRNELNEWRERAMNALTLVAGVFSFSILHYCRWLPALLARLAHCDVLPVVWRLQRSQFNDFQCFNAIVVQNEFLYIISLAWPSSLYLLQNMLNRRAFSEVLYDAPRASRLKEDARQVEFVRIGQALKLEAIVRGDAPTSLASTGPGTIFKRPPWEPQCFYAAFHHRGNIVGDSFGHDGLFLASDEGTFLIRGTHDWLHMAVWHCSSFSFSCISFGIIIFLLISIQFRRLAEDQSNQIVFDKTFAVRQMSVVEDHNIMLVRGGSATQKDSSRIHVFRLTEFKEENIRVRSRADLKERRIEKTRGCHLYATSKGGDGYFRMAVAVGRKLYTFQWKYTAAWTSWCTTNETETVEGFIFLRVCTILCPRGILLVFIFFSIFRIRGRQRRCGCMLSHYRV